MKTVSVNAGTARNGIYFLDNRPWFRRANSTCGNSGLNELNCAMGLESRIYPLGEAGRFEHNYVFVVGIAKSDSERDCRIEKNTQNAESA